MGQEMQKEHKSHPDTVAHLAPHLIFNAARSYKRPGREQGGYSLPFPGHNFPDSGIQCPDRIRITLPSHDQFSQTPLLYDLLLNLLILWQ